MSISIAVKGFCISDSIKSYVEEKIHKEIMQKYFHNDDTVKINVTISKDSKSSFVVNINLNDNHGEFITVSKSAIADAYEAIDKSIACISTKMRKYKDKVNKHRNKNLFKNSKKIKTYLLNDDYYEQDNEDESEGENEPIIIEESDVVLKNMSVSEAVMDMKLLSVPALLFINSKNFRINMVYVREDGNIAWVDPN